MSEQILEQKNEATLNINSNISIAEQRDFIEAVMFDVSLSEDDLLTFNTEVAFYKNFLAMFTDYETPFDEIDDVVLQMAIKEALLTSSFVLHLKACIEKQILMLAQKNDAIESVAFLANRTLDGVNKLCDILDNVKDLTKDGKFLKVIPKKKIDQIFDGIIRVLTGIVGNVESKAENTFSINAKDDANLTNIFSKLNKEHE